MRDGHSLIYCVLGGLLLIPGARAMAPDASTAPYQGITERNIFGLKPPPPLVRPEDLKQPPPDIKLTGITTILGMKQALLKTQIPARPPQPAREESYILTEGQSEGDIEVIAIDEKAGTVKVNNHGTPQTLDFTSNGVKLPAASTLAMAAPGAPPGPGPGPTINLPTPPGPGNPGFRGMGMRQIPTRPVRTDSRSEQDGGYQPPGTPNSGLAGAPGLAEGANFGANNSAPPPGSPQNPYGITGDQQQVLIELERERLKQSGNQEGASMLPITDFTQ